MADQRGHVPAHGKQSSRERFPADRKKGERERNLKERYGQRKDDVSTEPSGNDRHGASDAGEDASSGGEYLDVDPTRFPERPQGDDDRGRS
jgi:hypothetical protein